MTDAAIVIGVDRTGQMPPLGGAVSGATDFADWAQTQGMSTKLITDANDHDVTLEELQVAVEAVTKNRNCDKLIVYFAGHGFLLSPEVELWLLSRAPDRGSEAVNVQLSRYNARYSGIQHVIFVSDACRSGGPTHRHRSVMGASIFPAPPNYDYDGKLDMFYAARPGDVAHEYRDADEAADNYMGIFTECLLRGLSGKEPEVVQEITEGSQTRWLVLSDLLEAHLKKAVPLRAEEISIRLSQSPIIIPESRLPQYFGVLDRAPEGEAQNGQGEAPPLDVGDFVSSVQDEVMSFDETTDAASREATTDAHRLLVQQMDRVATSRGRDHYETETGFTIYGRIQSTVAGDGLGLEPFEDGEVTHIRVLDPQDGQGRSILIEFPSGFGTVLAIKPGFIGTVILDDDQVINVSYTPSSNTPLFQDEYLDQADRIERRRAFAAAAARLGMFRLDSESAENAGDYLRMLKGLDPTLGLYAAYAYFQAGRMSLVRNVFGIMANVDPQPVPFDVALLARFAGDHMSPLTTVAPFCPMLRQGWALLELHPPSFDSLHAYRSLLIPSLWTAFTPEGVARVRSALEAGELI